MLTSLYVVVVGLSACILFDEDTKSSA